ncbi:helix-turn-helix domain-containing protein [Echinicola vietnamensis]|uniref:Helix-turn-helix protein n=1 Tax=Echinicola vietnamensis (strain DSM 17526 / LMG 23754 / KMM 6221) TaxID=926556 RepID=L0G0Q4_ECHVK|nr:helix-turn-helix transcriptional regulator [Echinicola vietnamensis]AGA78888.1 Helix-turn-helix protein [Echinicola vietnamensis DSM 17526]
MKETLLRKLREEFKYDLDQVAAKIDSSVEDYLEIENGGKRLDILQAAKLGDLYNINPRYLLELAESINYNFGSHSRTIYTQNYFEGKDEN